ncbi:MAG: M28 family peptidase [Phycisphaerales bacterium]
MHALLLSTLLALGQPPAAPAPLPPIDESRLSATIRSLPAQRSPGPTDEHIAGLKQAEELLLAHAKRLGFEPTTQTIRWSRRDQPKHEWRNILFELTGSEKPSEVIIVAAHFDAVPDSPGADDNASGVAGLLEIARVLKARAAAGAGAAGSFPKRTIRFALFNLEEVGLVGASQYAPLVAERVEAGDDTVVGMLSLEMLGYYSDKPESQQNPFAALKGFTLPDTGDFIAIATTLAHRPFVRALEKHMAAAVPEAKALVFDLLPIAPPDLLRSDHAPFLLYGIPAAMVTDTANFRNPHYHQPSDTLETLDRPRFARTVAALAAGIAGLADEGIPAPGAAAPQKK